MAYKNIMEFMKGVKIEYSRYKQYNKHGTSKRKDGYNLKK